MKCNEQRTINTDLQIYKEKGKVVISKKSNQLGVVYLDKDEIRLVGSYLYKLVVKEDKKTCQ